MISRPVLGAPEDGLSIKFWSYLRRRCAVILYSFEKAAHVIIGRPNHLHTNITDLCIADGWAYWKVVFRRQ